MQPCTSVLYKARLCDLYTNCVENSKYVTVPKIHLEIKIVS